MGLISLSQNGEWTGYGSLTWPYVNNSSTGVWDGSKLSEKVAYAERGKPVYPPSFGQVKPQGTLLGMQVQESEESEGHSVMGWIQVERFCASTSPGSKEGPISDGASS